MTPADNLNPAAPAAPAAAPPAAAPAAPAAAPPAAAPAKPALPPGPGQAPAPAPDEEEKVPMATAHSPKAFTLHLTPNDSKPAKGVSAKNFHTPSIQIRVGNNEVPLALVEPKLHWALAAHGCKRVGG